MSGPDAYDAYDVKLPKAKTDRIRVVFTGISGIPEISEFIVLGSKG